MPNRGAILTAGGARPRVRELLDDRRAEGLEVVRRPARRELPVDDDLLVDDLGAGVAEVRPDARPGGHPPPAHDARLREGPGAVADRRDRLAGGDEVADERDGALVHAELVGIDRAAGQ